MKSALEYLKVDIGLDDEYLSKNSKTILKILIKNESDVYAENSLLNVFIDTKHFEVLDERLISCTNNFGDIGTLKPYESVSVNIPIKLISIPSTLKSSVSCVVNFHTVENNTLVDQNSRSNNYEIKIADINMLKNEDFIIESTKKSYLIDDDIHCLIHLKNSGTKDIENIMLENYVPLNTYLEKSSVVSSLRERLILNKQNMVITSLKCGEMANIKFKLNIQKNVDVRSIEITPSIRYEYEDIKRIEVKANTLSIKIEDKELFNKDSFSHKISKSEVISDEVVEHTVYIKNTSKSYISNILLTENIPHELAFIENSLFINGVCNHDVNELSNIKLGDLGPNEDIFVIYQTNVGKCFKPVSINSILTYRNSRRKFIQHSNMCNLNVIGALFEKDNFIKEQEKEYYSVGDLIDFEIRLMNTGNTSGINIKLTDQLPKELEFILNSLSINDCPLEKENILNGISINLLEPNKIISVKYKVRAKEICTKEKSNAVLRYGYIRDNRTFEVTSNDLETTVMGARIGENNFIKELSTNSCQIGDIITVRLYIENTGNIDCENLKIQEVYNNTLELIEDSLIIDGSKSSDLNIFEGINIKSLNIGQNLNVIYQLKVIDYSQQNPIDDKSKLTYSYVKDDQIKTRAIHSNRNKLYINKPNLTILDSSSVLSKGKYTKYVSYGDSVYFSLIFENKGNVGIEDINLKILLPDGLTLDNESIKFNNQKYNQDFLKSGKLHNLNISQKIHLDFCAKYEFCDVYEQDTTIFIDYAFKDIKTKNPFRKNIKLTESILILKPEIEIDKFISDKEVELNKEFTKNINIRNIGNVDLQDIKLNLNENDFLKQSESELFINGNFVKSNNIINIPEISIGEIINIAIRYKLESVPSYENILNESIVNAKYKISNKEDYGSTVKKSNKLNLNIKNYSLSINGNCGSKILLLNDFSTYTFTVANNGNMDCDNIKIIIDLPTSIEYRRDSITLNETRIYSETFKDGIEIGHLKAQESVNISFEFKPIKLPKDNKLKLDAIVNAKYNFDDNYIVKEFLSDTDCMDVENLFLDVVKTVSHDYLQSGDIFKVHTILQNAGTMELHNLSLKDNNEDNLSFIINSVFIDGENIERVDPVNGLNIKYLGPDESKLISYEYEYTPKSSNNKITHFSDVNYSYKTKYNANIKGLISRSNIIQVDGALSTFKQFSIEKEYALKKHEPNISEIISVFSNASIDEFEEVESVRNKSFNNVKSTGQKILIKGSIIDRIEYLIEGDNSGLYMLTRKEPFTTFINIPDSFSGEYLYFRAKCDDIYYKATDIKQVFVSRLISIEGSM